MSIILFYQSKQQELETILWTIKNHKQLEKFSSDTIYPKLPKKIWNKIVQDNVKFSNSRKIVQGYLKKTNQLNQQENLKKVFIPLWKKIEKEFFKKIKKILKIKILPKYICYLTQYGGGGSFNPPNTIWVRANKKNKNDIKYFTYTITHEIIHLLLHQQLKNTSQDKIENQIEKILIELNLFK
ncbi:MAG: hypothetical protein ABIC36_03560 [bacterium]